MVGKELDARCRILAEDISESVHIVDHDPSLALYRLQEHVRKSLPILVEKKAQVMQLNHNLQGGCYDLENAIHAVESIIRSSSNFSRIHEMLRSAMYHKQQLDYERMRRDDRGRLPRMESTDSLAQELKKSKSLGHLRGLAIDVLSESAGSSRSATSTPASDFPGSAASTTPTTPARGGTSGTSTDGGGNASTRSSTPTSGADSPADSDMDEIAVTPGAKIR
uniref:Uncharacterized protein n=1 Tax=Plectus sambesii TaxID=2011161 RepID=A0A914UZR3_9BILA